MLPLYTGVDLNKYLADQTPHLSTCFGKMLPATDIKEGFLEKTFLSASAEELIEELGRQRRKGDVA